MLDNERAKEDGEEMKDEADGAYVRVDSGEENTRGVGGRTDDAALDTGVVADKKVEDDGDARVWDGEDTDRSVMPGRG